MAATRPHLSTSFKIFLLGFLLIAIVVLQYGYDASVKGIVIPSSASSGVTPFMVRIADMGFDPAVASFLWATTMPEVIDLFAGKTEYIGDLAFVNGIDPKMSYPYAFSVLILPAVPASAFPDGLKDSFIIGQEGIANADPDWRIPYYMATNYYLGANDPKDALIYYDIAAHTPGIPQYAERFALNFGIGANQREQTEALWTTIRDTTNDEFIKERAQAYIDHLHDLDYLQAAAQTYKQKFGVYPTSTQELVTKNIIPSIPVDPFGFTFIINPDGTSGIDLTKLPSYIATEPAE
jgi:hypothetical protein